MQCTLRRTVIQRWPLLLHPLMLGAQVPGARGQGRMRSVGMAQPLLLRSGNFSASPSPESSEDEASARRSRRRPASAAAWRLGGSGNGGGGWADSCDTASDSGTVSLVRHSCGGSPGARNAVGAGSRLSTGRSRLQCTNPEPQAAHPCAAWREEAGVAGAQPPGRQRRGTALAQTLKRGMPLHEVQTTGPEPCAVW